jgi:hypothetical protein
MPIRRTRRRWAGRVGRLVVATTLASMSTIAGLATGTAHAAGVAGIIVSEVAPWASGNSTYASDWFEVTNTGPTAVIITGWKMDDNSNSFAASVALNGITSIAAGESVIFIESSTPATTIPAFTAAWFGTNVPAGLQLGTYSGSGVGLSTAGDAVNLFNAAGAVQAVVTFGASPGSAPFPTFDNAAGLDNTTISTLSVAGVNGAFNSASGTAAIGSPGTISGSGGPGTTTTTAASTTTSTTVPTGLPWPGDQTVQDASNYVFGGNLSGLIEEPSGTTAPGVLWGVRNGRGTLFRLLWDGTRWAPDSAGNWAAGKDLFYADGTGDPDSEGVTYAGSSPANGIFVSTERNNLANTVSRLSILRFDPTVPGSSLTATNDWNLTADLPATGPNLGLEAITWVPDTYLTANNFFDDHTGATYNPGNYANHGTGLFFVGVEGSGRIYGYALDQTGNSFTRVVSIANPFVSIMELQFDRDLNELWAVCDNTCNGTHALLRIDPSTGKFGVTYTFQRPTGMPDYNNEGFAIAPAAECANGKKPVYWADDTEDLGVAIRSGNIPCTAYAAVTAAVPEFPTVLAIPTAVLVMVAASVLLSHRRRRRAV